MVSGWVLSGVLPLTVGVVGRLGHDARTTRSGPFLPDAHPLDDPKAPLSQSTAARTSG